jgi:hypothetical protein
MTVTVTQYENLIVPEHQGQPNFTATIDLSCQPFVDGQNELAEFPTLFDLDVAVGVQLDAVGVRVGRSRQVNVPLTNVYFAWDTPGLGWDQGYWQGPFDPSTGVVSLDDATYRLLLRAVILTNTWNGTVNGAAPALAVIFNNTLTPGTLIFIYNGMDMTETIGIAGEVPPVIFQALLASGEIPLVPAGVRVNYIMISNLTGPLFGFDIENQYVSGWDVGSWGIPLPL